MIRCNANLYRIAMTCASLEEPRFRIGGVQIEPHPKGGVLMVATDGHRMLVIHDESGQADETATIKLDKDALKACKSKRGDRRILIIDSGMQEAAIKLVTGTDEEPEYSPIAMAYNVRVDGTYPDYRRVIPAAFDGKEMPAFNGGYLGYFGEIGADFAEHVSGMRRTTPGMRILPSDVDSAALIAWPGFDFAFGILMPMRAQHVKGVPLWFRQPAKAPAIAA